VYAKASEIPIIAVPFFLYLKDPKLALRFSQTFFIIGTLFLTYLFTIRFYNKKIALITTFLLLTFPPFILQPLAVYPFLSFFIIFILFLITCYIKTKKNYFLYLLFFILGLATTIKLIVFHFLLSLIFSFIFLKKFFRIKYHISTKQFLLAFFFFIIGLTPLIFAEFAYNFSMLNFLMSNFIITESGHKNFDIFNNIQTQLTNLFEYFSYLHCCPKTWYYSIIPFSIFIFQLLYLVILKNKKDLFMVMLFLFFLIFTQFSPTSTRPIHMFIIVPIILILVGIAIGKMPRILSILIIVLFLSFNLINLIKFYDELNNGLIITFLPEAETLINSIRNASTVVGPSILTRIVSIYFFDKKEIIALPQRADSPYYTVNEINETKFIFQKTLEQENVAYIFLSGELKVHFGRDITIYNTLPQILKNMTSSMNRTFYIYTINDTSGHPSFEVWII
jgi:hypothetical protein